MWVCFGVCKRRTAEEMWGGRGGWGRGRGAGGRPAAEGGGWAGRGAFRGGAAPRGGALARGARPGGRWGKGRKRRGRGAVLLLHVSPGSPAEMLAVGQLFAGAGWSVRGLLLPGFGAEFSTLADKRHTDWDAAIDAALLDLRSRYASVAIAGTVSCSIVGRSIWAKP